MTCWGFFFLFDIPRLNYGNMDGLWVMNEKQRQNNKANAMLKT